MNELETIRQRLDQNYLEGRRFHDAMGSSHFLFQGFKGDRVQFFLLTRGFVNSLFHRVEFKEGKVLARNNLAEGTIATFFPADLILFHPQPGVVALSPGVTVPQTNLNLKPVSISPEISILGHPELNTEPQYSGHLIRRVNCPDKANTRLLNLTYHLAVLTTKEIKKGDELLLFVPNQEREFGDLNQLPILDISRS